MDNYEPTVAVLMSTYNGEKYIREQLDSILTQRGVNVKLIIRDDGSTDSTPKILREYEKKYSLFLFKDKENLGAGESFLRLLYEFAFAPGVDYFAFADQDDIWLEDKLFTGVNAIKKCGITGPVLYTSNQYIYIDGVNTGKRFKKVPSINLVSRLMSQDLYGCTFVFNKELAELITTSKHPNDRFLKFRYHDSWVLLTAVVCGHVLFDIEPHILYRIHGGNLVGSKDSSVLTRLSRLQRLIKDQPDSNLRMLSAQLLLDAFPKMEESKKNVLKLIANYQNSWKDKWALLSNKEIMKQCTENPFIFKIKVLINFV